jgi:hypothetical protein
MMSIYKERGAYKHWQRNGEIIARRLIGGIRPCNVARMYDLRPSRIYQIVQRFRHERRFEEMRRNRYSKSFQ